MYSGEHDTILARATGTGTGAIALLRLSGPQAIAATEQVFRPRKKDMQLHRAPSHTAWLGEIRDGEALVDEVLVTVFRNPHSFTGEDVIEISCHGSAYIQQRILQLFLSRGLRLAKPGEFTQRAFLNGKMDLSQAEAVADLIAAESEAAHKLALHQMRGGFSKEINALRQQLMDFAALVELELDFAEEDVEFANRQQLQQLVLVILEKITRLMESFRLGNAIKNGIPIVIAGRPNAGKSTLLNALLNEEKALVSDIPGTTRDVIEDTLVLHGVLYRFVDTAGLRDTSDQLEAMGIERTRQKLKEASLLLYLVDVTTIREAADYDSQHEEVKQYGIPYIMVLNKAEAISEYAFSILHTKKEVVLISAKERKGLDELQQRIIAVSGAGALDRGDLLVTNTRHVEALQRTREFLEKTLSGLEQQIPGDLLAMDLRQALYHLGEITGQVTADDLLGNIFSRFCIGK